MNCICGHTKEDHAYRDGSIGRCLANEVCDCDDYSQPLHAILSGMTRDYTPEMEVRPWTPKNVAKRNEVCGWNQAILAIQHHLETGHTDCEMMKRAYPCDQRRKAS